MPREIPAPLSTQLLKDAYKPSWREIRVNWTMPKERTLYVLSRSSGVRKENPLLQIGKYYPHPAVRSPELRNEADDILKEDYRLQAAKRALNPRHK